MFIEESVSQAGAILGPVVGGLAQPMLDQATGIVTAGFVSDVTNVSTALLNCCFVPLPFSNRSHCCRT